jgi:gluconolactonase
MIPSRAVALTALLACFSACATGPAEVRAPGAEVVKLADGFSFTEGPAADAEGNIVFSDIPNRRIHRWSADEGLTLFRDDLEATNGLYYDSAGNLIVCEMEHRRISSVAPDGSVTLLADNYAGRKFNSPNDLWVDPMGGVYFTDPYYGDDPRSLEQGGYYVFYVTPEREVLRVLDDLVGPNGIIGTADGKLLYIGDSGDEKTWVYAVQPDGSLTEKRLFVSEAHDGLTMDERGNVYVTGEHVNVYTSDGELIETIVAPEQPANLTFGGPEGRTLFMTARSGFYSLRMSVRGQ